MHKYDAPKLVESLNGLAETFDKKPITQKAADVWFDALKEFSTDRVMGILHGWAKRNGKFPTPAEVWKIVNEISIEERETQAAAERHEARSPVRFQKSDAGKRALAEIKSIMGPKPTPRETWHRCMSLNAPGSYQYDMAVAALAKLNHKRAQPQDLEEAA